MATYVNDLRLKEIATGDESGTWGASVNTQYELIGEAMGAGTEAIADASTHTITMADGATDGFRCTFLRLTGGGQACTVTLAPNTVSHTWIIRNATSYALTFTQGSGANVIIAAGQAKIVSTDGAGSGAIVYECLEDLELGGTLTVGIDDTGQDVKFYGATSGKYWLWDESADGVVQQGTLTVGVDDTGYDVKLFGATSGAYMLWDESADDLKLVGAAGLTVAGDIDIDGTANLDIVDIDGAVDMATTALVTGVLTTTATQVATGGITSGSNILSDTDSTDSLGSTGVRWLKGWFDTLTAGTLTIGSGSVTDSSGAISFGNENLTTTGIVTAAGTSVFTNLDISGDVDVDGTTNLDVVDIDGAVDMATTLGVTGVVTANAGVVVDEMTLDADTLTATDDFIVDAVGDIVLDSDDANWRFKDAGTAILEIANPSGPSFYSPVSDADILFKGNDGGSTVTALTLDMSAAGAATFSAGIGFNGDTATANMLDDYEEGTFTPTWTVTGGGSASGGLATNVGRYTKVGRMCTMSWESFIISTSGTITAYRLNLPFQVDANCRASGMASEFAQTGYGWKMSVEASGTFVTMTEYDGTAPPGNAYVLGSLTYQTV